MDCSREFLGVLGTFKNRTYQFFDFSPLSRFFVPLNFWYFGKIPLLVAASLSDFLKGEIPSAGACFHKKLDLRSLENQSNPDPSKEHGVSRKRMCTYQKSIQVSQPSKQILLDVYE